jgi:hypothetical protein
MQNFAAGFGFKGLPDGRKRVGAVSCAAQAEFIGREDVPRTGADIDNSHIGASDVGVAHNFQICAKPESGT